MVQIIRYYGNTIITILSCAMILGIFFGAYRMVNSTVGRKTALTMIKGTGSGDADAQHLLDTLDAKPVVNMTDDILGSDMTDFSTEDPAAAEEQENASQKSALYQMTEKMKRAGTVYYFWKDPAMADVTDESTGHVPDELLKVKDPNAKVSLLGITDAKRRYDSGSGKAGTYYYPVISLKTGETVPENAVCWIRENTGTAYVRFPHEGYYNLRTTIIAANGQQKDVSLYVYVGR